MGSSIAVLCLGCKLVLVSSCCNDIEEKEKAGCLLITILK